MSMVLYIRVHSLRLNETGQLLILVHVNGITLGVNEEVTCVPIEKTYQCTSYLHIPFYRCRRYVFNFVDCVWIREAWRNCRKQPNFTPLIRNKEVNDLYRNRIVKNVKTKPKIKAGHNVRKKGRRSKNRR